MFGSVGQQCNWKMPKSKPCMYFLVQVHYSFVLQTASLTCQWQWGRCTNLFSHLRSIMKASINICSCSKIVSKSPWLCLLSAEAGRWWETEADWEANSSFCTYWASKWVQTGRSFHGAAPQGFLLWLNCSIQLSQKNQERLWWKRMSVYSIFLTGQKQLLKNYSEERVEW